MVLCCLLSIYILVASCYIISGALSHYGWHWHGVSIAHSGHSIFYVRLSAIQRLFSSIYIFMGNHGCTIWSVGMEGTHRLLYSSSRKTMHKKSPSSLLHIFWVLCFFAQGSFHLDDLQPSQGSDAIWYFYTTPTIVPLMLRPRLLLKIQVYSLFHF